ncbi:MAG: hypothetical protein HOW73_03670 [Polyangiaceae bacterium]|nr:hypothetical protein [Polyangiaceae bacterium]
MSSNDDDDLEDRAAILRRRAVFVVSAVAGMTLAACGDDPKPKPCLNMPATGQPEATAPQPCLDVAPPQACLSPPLPPQTADAGTEVAPADAGIDAAKDAGPSDAGATDAGPQDAGPKPPPRPCLKMAPPPPPPTRPTVCLNFVAPEDESAPKK